MFKNWTDIHTEKFGKEPFTVEHNLAATGLFTDEALAKMLDAHPRDMLDICTLANHEIYQAKFRTGESSEVDGQTLIEAAKSGTIWMNVRNSMNLHPEYKEVLDEMYGSLTAKTKQRILNPRGSLLITAPIAQTPYHFDTTETILWHVRGHKRFFLYPQTPEFLPDEGFERVLYKTNEDYLPYTKDMDSQAQVFDLHGDEMISWPLNAPHRVENKSFCVSVTTEYSTRECVIKNSAMYTHAFMRKKMGLNPSWEKATRPGILVKAVAGRVLRRMNAMGSLHQNDMVTFKVDPTAPGYIRDTEPYERVG